MYEKGLVRLCLARQKLAATALFAQRRLVGKVKKGP